MLNGRKAALVEFYAPWYVKNTVSMHGMRSSHTFCCRCGHCKSLVPEMKTLGGAYLQEPSLADQVVIAKVRHHSMAQQRM